MGDSIVTGAAGLGIAIIGAGLYYLFGGKSESLDGYEVHMDFNEPADQAECRLRPSTRSDEMLVVSLIAQGTACHPGPHHTLHCMPPDLLCLAIRSQGKWK